MLDELFKNMRDEKIKSGKRESHIESEDFEKYYEMIRKELGRTIFGGGELPDVQEVRTYIWGMHGKQARELLPRLIHYGELTTEEGKAARKQFNEMVEGVKGVLIELINKERKPTRLQE